MPLARGQATKPPRFAPRLGTVSGEPCLRFGSPLQHSRGRSFVPIAPAFRSRPIIHSHTQPPMPIPSRWPSARTVSEPLLVLRSPAHSRPCAPSAHSAPSSGTLPPRPGWTRQLCASLHSTTLTASPPPRRSIAFRQSQTAETSLEHRALPPSAYPVAVRKDLPPSAARPPPSTYPRQETAGGQRQRRTPGARPH